MDLLRTKLWAKRLEEAHEEKSQLQGDYSPATWGTQIRSYVLHPYKMVKDLRTDIETSNTDAVLDGDLDEFIEAEIKLE
jgi:peptide chain release factor 2